MACTPPSEEPPAATQPPVANVPNPQGDPALAFLSGLTLADSLETARKLYPVPDGGKQTPQPLRLLDGEAHYGWQAAGEMFDAYGLGDRLTTVIHLRRDLQASARDAIIDREIERYDEPLENSETDATSAYLWRDGDYVRLVVNFSGPSNSGLLTVIGIADYLQDRGLPIDNIDHLVEAFESNGLQ